MSLCGCSWSEYWKNNNTSVAAKKAARWGHWVKPKCRHIAPIDRIIFADGFSPFLKGTAVWKQSFFPLSFFCKMGFPTCLWLWMKCGNSKLLKAPYQCVNMQGLQDAVDTYFCLIKTLDCDTFINLDGCLRIMASQQPEINGIVPTAKVRNFLVVLKHFFACAKETRRYVCRKLIWALWPCCSHSGMICAAIKFYFTPGPAGLPWSSSRLFQ